MRRSQILSLFICNLVPYIVGNGLIPLLPIYAKKLGASSAVAGYYLAFIYIAIAFGAVFAGWVSDNFHRRKIPIIITGLASIPIALLLGRVSTIWLLSILTALLWFCGGMGLGLIGILAGISAGKDERGKIFGILSITVGLGALIGGLSFGFLVDQWGFATMFSAVAGLLILWPFSGYFLSEKIIDVEKDFNKPVKIPGLGRNYYLLFSASLFASTAGFFILLGRSLLMEELKFGAIEISITGAMSGIVAMIMPFLMSWLSDRFGRKIFLYLGYLACITSLTILAVSVSLWQFIIALALQAIFMGVNTSVGNALVTDLLPQESLGRGVARYSATTWIGGVLGFACAGYALQNLGTLPTFTIGISLPLIAMVILIFVRSGAKEEIRIALNDA